MAITRVTERARLLILRAFAAETFQQGDKSFRSLLLQQWRHHDVNWEEVLGNCVKTRVCNECRAARLRRDYTAANWNCSTDDIVCREYQSLQRARHTFPLLAVPHLAGTGSIQTAGHKHQLMAQRLPGLHTEARMQRVWFVVGEELVRAKCLGTKAKQNV